MNYPTQAEALIWIARTDFQPFSQGDWYAFAGCESDNPYIGCHNGYIIVIDGDKVNIVHENDEFGGKLYSFEELA